LRHVVTPDSITHNQSWCLVSAICPLSPPPTAARFTCAHPCAKRPGLSSIATDSCGGGGSARSPLPLSLTNVPSPKTLEQWCDQQKSPLMTFKAQKAVRSACSQLDLRIFTANFRDLNFLSPSMSPDHRGAATTNCQWQPRTNTTPHAAAIARSSASPRPCRSRQSPH